MAQSRSIRRRTFVSLAAVGGLVAAFSARLFDLQVVRAAAFRKQAAGTVSASAVIFASRGDIVDTNGAVLAHTPQRWDITAAPDSFASWTQHVPATQVTSTIAKLAKATGAEAADLTKALTADPTSKWAMLVKAVDLAVLNRVKKVGMPWVVAQTNQNGRIYPQGAIAGNLVGFMGEDGPLAGLELGENADLAGTNGVMTYEHGADWVQIPGSQLITRPAKDGRTLQLSIDSDLHWFVQQTLQEQAQANGCSWATATVVRIKDAHLMVAAQWPTVDPNNVDGTDKNDRGARYFVAPYEPGSIMKPATVASLMDAGVLTPYDKIVVPSLYTTGFPKGAAIKDVFPHGEMHWTATGIINQSSNIGISVISERLDIHARTAYLKKFGFGSKTAVDFLGESGGIVQNPDTIDPISNKAQQFGQGISVTAAQLAEMYQTIGNKGVKLPLVLVEGAKGVDGSMIDTPSTVGERVVSEQAANNTLLMMETVAQNSNISAIVTIPGYRLACKTGTAQVADATTHAYGADRIVSVAGVSTVDNPEYAVIVTLADPDRIKTSVAAAPAWVAIMKQVIKTYRVPPSTTAPGNLPITW